MKELYTICDLSEMTGLTTRTLRNYIQLGILNGEKLGGVWQFTPEEFSSFLEQDMVAHTLSGKRNSIVYDFLLDEKKGTDQSCQICDFVAADEEAAREIQEGFLDQVNSGRFAGLRFSYHYGAGSHHVRVILTGPGEELHKLMCAYYS